MLSLNEKYCNHMSFLAIQGLDSGSSICGGRIGYKQAG
jgi:hypothetical protein